MADNGEFSERRAREVAEHAREAEWRQPSFGKELFLGRLRLDLVHPHPSGSPESRGAWRGVPGDDCASSASRRSMPR